ncbi:hypothetical protein ACHWQZ_G013813 [Mnemiopsis leidyi]
MSELTGLFENIKLEKGERSPLTCQRGTGEKPQPAVVLVLDHNVLEEDISNFVSLLKTLDISAFVERSTNHELVFVCLYLDPGVCEEMAQKLSYHVPFHTYKSKNPPETWTTKLYSALFYGTLSYDNFTEIQYSVMFHDRLKTCLEPEKMDYLHSLRVQSEIIYNILEKEEIFMCKIIKIDGHFVPHSPEATDLWNKVSWFPPFFPLKEFRDYFGEELAFTYAWSNFWWIFGLVPITIFALFCLILGLASQNFHEFDDTIADPTWSLFSRIMVNGSTFYYILFVMIWIAVFQNQWSSAAPLLSLQWGVSNFYLEEPRYKSPKQAKYRKFLAVPNLIISCFGFMVAFALTAALFIFVEILLRAQLHDRLDMSYINIVCPLIYTILNTLAGSYFIPWLATFLTDCEDHKFHSYYTNSIIFKYTGYYLMSSYCYLIFLALDVHAFIFHKYGIELREPNIDAQQFEVIELSQQLLFQIIALRLKSIGLTFLQWALNKFQSRKMKKDQTQERDFEYILDNYRAYQLLDTNQCSMWMSERIIMYGYLTMFSYHVPIVAFIALVLELIVTRYELYMLLRGAQRPRPRRVGNIQQWEGILYLVNIMSIIINSYSIYLRYQEANKMDEGYSECWVSREDSDTCIFDRRVYSILLMSVLILMTSLIQIQSDLSGDKRQFHTRNQYKLAVDLFADDFINTDGAPHQPASLKI